MTPPLYGPLSQLRLTAPPEGEPSGTESPARWSLTGGFVRTQKKRAEARPLSIIVVSFAGDDIDHAVLFKVNDSVSVVNPPAPHAAEIFF